CRASGIRTTLPGAAVASEAAVSEVNAFAIGGVALMSVLGLGGGECRSAENGHGERRERDTLEPLHGKISSTRISDDINHGGFAVLDDVDSASQRGRKVLR